MRGEWPRIMFDHRFSEATSVRPIRSRAARTVGLVVLVLVGAPALVPAQPQQPQQPQQRGGPPNPDTPRILVATFRSDERQLGVQAADALRKRIQDENSAKQLFAVTKREVDATLQQSGYNPDSALSTNDLMELGHQVRADEVVDATVRKMADGQVRIDARLLLKRNQNILAQPLPPGLGKNAGDAAQPVERALGLARKSLPAYKTCENDLRAQKYDAAMADGRAAIAAYPQSTFGRLCLLTAFSLSKAAPDSIIKVANEILGLDSTSVIALSTAADAYKTKGNADKFIEYALKIYHADPNSNEPLAISIVSELAKIGRYVEGLQLADEVLTRNPDAFEVVRLKLPLQLAAKQFKDAYTTADLLAARDTSIVTPDFVMRMVGAAQADSNPQKQLEYVSRGARRFPKNADLQLVHAQLLYRAGQLEPALAAASATIAAEPNNAGAYPMILVF